MSIEMSKLELVRSLKWQMDVLVFDKADRLQLATDFMTLARSVWQIEKMEWETYTPTFNDGDSCDNTFRECLRLYTKEDIDNKVCEGQIEELYFQYPPAEKVETLEDPVERLNGLGFHYVEAINLLTDLDKIQTNTRYIYAWNGDVLVESQEEYDYDY